MLEATFLHTSSWHSTGGMSTMQSLVCVTHPSRWGSEGAAEIRNRMGDATSNDVTSKVIPVNVILWKVVDVLRNVMHGPQKSQLSSRLLSWNEEKVVMKVNKSLQKVEQFSLRQISLRWVREKIIFIPNYESRTLKVLRASGLRLVRGWMAPSGKSIALQPWCQRKWTEWNLSRFFPAFWLYFFSIEPAAPGLVTINILRRIRSNEKAIMPLSLEDFPRLSEWKSVFLFRPQNLRNKREETLLLACLRRFKIKFIFKAISSNSNENAV